MGKKKDIQLRQAFKELVNKLGYHTYERYNGEIELLEYPHLSFNVWESYSKKSFDLDKPATRRELNNKINLILDHFGLEIKAEPEKEIIIKKTKK